MNANTSLDKLIYFKREEKGMTREQLAELLGITSRTIYYWETDSERKPKLSMLFQLSQILDIPINDMLFN